ncbi:PIN domain-containing protein [Candidatus Pacearchaeota archaeon]|nr:PIN domain-containing protein [Candidatus Pacearchaeota archaeon]
MKIIFDTFAWIEYFEGGKKGLEVKNYLENNEVLTPLIVLLELSYKADKEGWNCKELLDFIKHNSQIAGINEEFVLEFGKLYNKTKKKIKSMGFADMIILNTAILNDAKVLTGDPHLSRLGTSIML